MLQCRDIDALMMDWLYGELAPQQAQNFSTHLEDCSRCHTELAAFERTRELFGVLPTEEPPAALSALLIREAANRSSAKAAATGGGVLGWLRGLLQPLQHPAMAAVATLVLVVAVAGTFYIRGDDPTEVSADFESAPATASVEKAGDKAAAPSLPGAVTEESELQNEIAAAKLETETKTDPNKPTAPTEGAVAQAITSPATGEEGRRADLLEAKQKEAARDLLAQRKGEKVRAEKRSTTRNRGKKARLADRKVNAVSGTDPLNYKKGLAKKAPQRAQKEKPKTDQEFAGNADSNRPYRAYRDRPGSWVSKQQLRITEAYSRKDCVTAAKIANDILDRSPDLYTKNTKKLEGVKRCKAYVQKETKKRRMARQKRSKGNGKAAGKAKRSAQPAPASEADLESME